MSDCFLLERLLNLFTALEDTAADLSASTCSDNAGDIKAWIVRHRKDPDALLSACTILLEHPQDSLIVWIRRALAQQQKLRGSSFDATMRCLFEVIIELLSAQSLSIPTSVFGQLANLCVQTVCKAHSATIQSCALSVLGKILHITPAESHSLDIPAIFEPLYATVAMGGLKMSQTVASGLYRVLGLLSSKFASSLPDKCVAQTRNLFTRQLKTLMESAARKQRTPRATSAVSLTTLAGLIGGLTMFMEAHPLGTDSAANALIFHACLQAMTVPAHTIRYEATRAALEMLLTHSDAFRTEVTGAAPKLIEALLGIAAHGNDSVRRLGLRTINAVLATMVKGMLDTSSLQGAAPRTASDRRSLFHQLMLHISNALSGVEGQGGITLPATVLESSWSHRSLVLCGLSMLSAFVPAIREFEGQSAVISSIDRVFSIAMTTFNRSPEAAETSYFSLHEFFRTIASLFLALSPDSVTGGMLEPLKGLFETVAHALPHRTFLPKYRHLLAIGCSQLFLALAIRHPASLQHTLSVAAQISLRAALAPPPVKTDNDRENQPKNVENEGEDISGDEKDESELSRMQRHTQIFAAFWVKVCRSNWLTKLSPSRLSCIWEGAITEAIVDDVETIAFDIVFSSGFEYLTALDLSLQHEGSASLASPAAPASQAQEISVDVGQCPSTASGETPSQVGDFRLMLLLVPFLVHFVEHTARRSCYLRWAPVVLRELSTQALRFPHVSGILKVIRSWLLVGRKVSLLSSQISSPAPELPVEEEPPTKRSRIDDDTGIDVPIDAEIAVLGDASDDAIGSTQASSTQASSVLAAQDTWAFPNSLGEEDGGSDTDASADFSGGIDATRTLVLSSEAASEQMQTSIRTALLPPAIVSLLTSFVRKLTDTLPESRGDLLVSTLELILVAPIGCLEVDVVDMAITRALALYSSLPNLVSAVVTSVEFWIRTSGHRFRNIAPALIRPFQSFLMNAASDAPISNVDAPKLQSHRAVWSSSAQRKVTFDDETLGRDPAEDLRRLYSRIARIIAAIGTPECVCPSMNLQKLRDADSNASTALMDSLAAEISPPLWISPLQPSVTIPLPFVGAIGSVGAGSNVYNESVHIPLESILPRILEIALSAAHPAKTAACEVLHFAVVYLVGRTAHSGAVNRLSHATLLNPLFNGLVQLVGSAHPVANRLFKTLLTQLSHWYGINSLVDSDEARELVNALLKGIGSCDTAQERDVAVRCLVEYCSWSIRGQAGSHSAVNDVVAKLLDLTRHSNRRKRDGASIALASLARNILAKDEVACAMSFDLCHSILESLEICDRESEASVATRHLSLVLRMLQYVFGRNPGISAITPGKIIRSSNDLLLKLFASTVSKSSIVRSSSRALWVTVVSAVSSGGSTESAARRLLNASSKNRHSPLWIDNCGLLRSDYPVPRETDSKLLKLWLVDVECAISYVSWLLWRKFLYPSYLCPPVDSTIPYAPLLRSSFGNLKRHILEACAFISSGTDNALISSYRLQTPCVAFIRHLFKFLTLLLRQFPDTFRELSAPPMKPGDPPSLMSSHVFELMSITVLCPWLVGFNFDSDPSDATARAILRDFILCLSDKARSDDSFRTHMTSLQSAIKKVLCRGVLEGLISSLSKREGVVPSFCPVEISAEKELQIPVTIAGICLLNELNCCAIPFAQSCGIIAAVVDCIASYGSSSPSSILARVPAGVIAKLRIFLSLAMCADHPNDVAQHLWHLLFSCRVQDDAVMSSASDDTLSDDSIDHGDVAIAADGTILMNTGHANPRKRTRSSRSVRRCSKPSRASTDKVVAVHDATGSIDLFSLFGEQLAKFLVRFAPNGVQRLCELSNLRSYDVRIRFLMLRHTITFISSFSPDCVLALNNFFRQSIPNEDSLVSNQFLLDTMQLIPVVVDKCVVCISDSLSLLGAVASLCLYVIGVDDVSKPRGLLRLPPSSICVAVAAIKAAAKLISALQGEQMDVISEPTSQSNSTAVFDETASATSLSKALVDNFWRLVVSEFPLRHTDIPPGDPAYDNYFELVTAMCEALSSSRSPALLSAFTPFYRSHDHPLALVMMQSLSALFHDLPTPALLVSLGVCVDNAYNEVLSEELRRAALTRMAIPALEVLCDRGAALSTFFSDRIVELMETSKVPTAKELHLASLQGTLRSLFVRKISALFLLEAMFEMLPVNVIRAEIAAVYCSHSAIEIVPSSQSTAVTTATTTTATTATVVTEEKGTEFIKAVMKMANTAVKWTPPDADVASLRSASGGVLPRRLPSQCVFGLSDDLLVEYRQTAFTLLAAGVLKTQTKTRIIAQFLLASHVWKATVADCDPPVFGVETHFKFAYAVTRSLRSSWGQQGAVNLADVLSKSDIVASLGDPRSMAVGRRVTTARLKAAPSVLRERIRGEASLFVGTSQVGTFSQAGEPNLEDSTLSSSAVDQIGEDEHSPPSRISHAIDARKIDLRQESEWLELDEVCGLGCMRSLLQCMDKLVELGEFGTEGISILPQWIEDMCYVLQDPSAPLTVRLFIARVVINRASIFSAYASHFFVPFSRLAVAIDNHKSLHYFIRDLCCTLISWDSDTSQLDAPSKLVTGPQSQAAAEGLLHLVSSRAFYHVKEIFRHNVKLCQLMFRRWYGAGEVFRLSPAKVCDKSLLLNHFKEGAASTESIATAHVNCALHISAVLLEHHILLFDPQLDGLLISQESFYEQILFFFSHKSASIRGLTGELVGLAIKELYRRKHNFATTLHYLAESRLSSMHDAQQYDHFCDVLNGVTPHFPQLAARFVPGKVHSILNSSSVLKTRQSCLRIIARWLRSGESALRLYVELHFSLKRIIMASEYNLQIAGLELLNLLVSRCGTVTCACLVFSGPLSEIPSKSISDLAAQFSPKARTALIKTLASVLSCLLTSSETKNEDASSLSLIESLDAKSVEESVELVISCARVFLADSDADVVHCALEFFHKSGLLSTDNTPLRVSQLFRRVLPDSESSNAAAWLLLAGAAESPDYDSKTAFFSDSLSKSADNVRANLVLDPNLRSLPMTPMFSTSIHHTSAAPHDSFHDSGTAAGKDSQRAVPVRPAGHILATLAPLSFPKALYFGSFVETANAGTMQRAGESSFSDEPSQLAFGTLSSFKPPTISAPRSSLSQATSGAVLLRRRFSQQAPDNLRQSFISRSVNQKRMKIAHAREQERLRGVPTIYRQYRLDEVPDIMVSPLDFVMPLQRLVLSDESLSALVLVETVIALLPSTSSEQRRLTFSSSRALLCRQPPPREDEFARAPFGLTNVGFQKQASGAVRSDAAIWASAFIAIAEFVCSSTSSSVLRVGHFLLSSFPSAAQLCSPSSLAGAAIHTKLPTSAATVLATALNAFASSIAPVTLPTVVNDDQSTRNRSWARVLLGAEPSGFESMFVSPRSVAQQPLSVEAQNKDDFWMGLTQVLRDLGDGHGALIALANVSVASEVVLKVSTAFVRGNWQEAAKLLDGVPVVDPILTDLRVECLTRLGKWTDVAALLFPGDSLQLESCFSSGRTSDANAAISWLLGCVEDFVDGAVTVSSIFSVDRLRATWMDLEDQVLRKSDLVTVSALSTAAPLLAAFALATGFSNSACRVARMGLQQCCRSWGIQRDPVTSLRVLQLLCELDEATTLLGNGDVSGSKLDRFLGDVLSRKPSHHHDDPVAWSQNCIIRATMLLSLRNSRISATSSYSHSSESSLVFMATSHIFFNASIFASHYGLSAICQTVGKRAQKCLDSARHILLTETANGYQSDFFRALLNQAFCGQLHFALGKIAHASSSSVYEKNIELTRRWLQQSYIGSEQLDRFPEKIIYSKASVAERALFWAGSTMFFSLVLDGDDANPASPPLYEGTCDDLPGIRQPRLSDLENALHAAFSCVDALSKLDSVCSGLKQLTRRHKDPSFRSTLWDTSHVEENPHEVSEASVACITTSSFGPSLDLIDLAQRTQKSIFTFADRALRSTGTPNPSFVQVALCAFAASPSEALVPRIIDIVSRHPDANSSFVSLSETVPVQIFLPWVSQIFSWLNHSNGDVFLVPLKRLALAYTQPVFFAFNCCKSQLTKAGIVDQVQSAFRHSDWTFFEAFTRAAEGLHHPELRLKSALALYREHPSKHLLDSITETLFNPDRADGAYNRKFAANYAKKWASVVVQKAENVRYSDFRDLYMHADKNMKLKGSKEGDQYTDLSTFSEWMFKYAATPSSDETPLFVPGLEFQGIRVSSFGRRLRIMPSMQKPKRLEIYGSDQNVYTFLVKGGEDLRQDARIQQTLVMFNRVLSSGIGGSQNLGFQRRPISDARTASFSTFVGTYVVTPLSPDIGFVGWFEETSTLKSLLASSLSSYGTDYINGGYAAFEAHLAAFARVAPRGDAGAYYMSTFADHRDSNFSHHCRKFRKSFDDIVAQRPGGDALLVHALVRLSSTADAFWRIRQNFISSYATSCVVQWILGVGDRHPDNIMLHNITGTVVPIDFGHAFGSATEILPVPELVPIRVTPVIQAVCKPFPFLKYFSARMADVMRTLSDEKEFLHGIISVFVREPLAEWARHAVSSASRLALSNNSLDVFDLPPPQSESPPHSVSLAYTSQKISNVYHKLSKVHPVDLILRDLQLSTKPPVVKAFKRISAVLRGNKNENLRANYGLVCGSVEEQIDCLLDLSSDSNILGRMWAGWAPYY